MEQRYVFDTHQPPDAALAYVARALETKGFTVTSGATFDVDARKGARRVLVGIAPHEKGLIARVNCKTLIPGASDRLETRIRSLLRERLGEPVREEIPDA